ncbi:MAG TPA: aminotransferase class V-fold PLP-dependent enzyme, partial [Afifellaceae bacterium]|nr:aminotransferase class V-fold PLP-dependent enzyme [Afifellaceae bacterium]
MKLARREFLAASGAAVAAGVAGACSQEETVQVSGQEEARRSAARMPAPNGDEWQWVRDEFALSEGTIHMSAMLVTSHPRLVREAIDEHRRGLDADPITYLEAHDARLKQAARDAAGRYLDVDGSQIALTDSTTMGVGLVYNCLRLNEGDEILSTDEGYYVTHESIRLAAERSGATVRKISLYDDIAQVSDDEIVSRIADSIRPETRVLALTWVHSSTGLKLPVAQIAAVVEEANGGRDDADRILFCLDAVHGFGIEDVTFPELGCDFYMAGCHKWLFGPRGTGIVAGTERAWRSTIPAIPSFIDDRGYDSWIRGVDPGPTTAAAMTPGGFKPFEHQWALAPAFEFHEEMGRARVAERTHELAGRLKEGLTEMSHVALRTP